MNVATIDQYTVRVYAEDVDFMGIVYHANYLCYLERARSELLRTNNWTLSDLIQQNILFAIKELVIKYIHPAKLDDLLTITTQIKELRACSFLFEQAMTNQHGKLICNAEIQVVCVNGDLKPQRLPELNRQ
ncbi:YbgC/FadM family acyl-CoA thioesterase [Legionella maioricensis]|uniref:YbgC/FadM family acyl-CoA thioesterase n=1 Tax=Legionella maioricensis TaxID=2896528 RepID=A0A9X2IDI4_9GAMM|nr:YbgC/FadM family acyl-CoA thioesterase [Legionella maioricensis]MCL9685567.1 YbgC/FadM family acyl-CoA thioesterase [Legionella maioricensis]MCL9688930.1 YbgC/FadM family acyl-CoA thioesterase [Legionella maioricensis]